MFIPTLSRTIFCVILLWAGVYLPALGSLEIQGEEGRRLLVGVEMLKNGDWLLPRIGGEPYLRKPPMINWVTAISQDIGGRNEWAARMPSALAVLLLGVVIMWTCSAWLGPAGALLAALFAIGNISMIEKGRLAEIEALYMVFTGLAVVWWVSNWVKGASPWRMWLPAGAFLGLGMLTKGPVHLIFFYGVVAGVLWAGSKRGLSQAGWRGWLHPAHWAGVLVMTGIFALWAWPYLKITTELDGGGVWLKQFTGRLISEEDGGGTDWGNYVFNFPRALFNFFPWIFLLPLLWRRGVVDGLPPRLAAVFIGMRAGMVVTFFGMLLVPGSSSRFVMPLLIVPSLLLAMVLVHSPAVLPVWLRTAWRRVGGVGLWICAAGALAVPFVAGFSLVPIALALVIAMASGMLIAQRHHFTGWLGVSLLSIAVMVLAMLVYAAGAVPVIKRHGFEKPVAHTLNAVLPPGEPVTVFRPGFQPFLYYVREPVWYANGRADITPATRFVLVYEDRLEDVVMRKRPARGEPWLTIPDKNRKPMVLIELEPVAR